jgi:hypothetical protein
MPKRSVRERPFSRRKSSWKFEGELSHGANDAAVAAVVAARDGRTAADVLREVLELLCVLERQRCLAHVGVEAVRRLVSGPCRIRLLDRGEGVRCRKAEGKIGS